MTRARSGWLGMDKNNMSKLRELCSEFIDLLDKREVTDNGREFSPTTIHSCRCMDLERISEIIVEMKTELEPSTNSTIKGE